VPPPDSQPPRAGAGDLARRIAGGDEAAFASFYEAWFAPTLALARAISRRDEAFALDVVQDVMLTVVRKLPPLGDDVAVRAWMTRTIANMVTDHLRTESRRRRREQDVVARRDGRTEQEPWLHLVAHERQTWLLGVLDGLPALDRELLAARFGSPTSVAAAAAAHGLGEDAAHGRLRRALTRLRHAAGEWLHG
jgi:RNA polymerase sigma-70 factor, ECF subfamily